MSTPVLAVDDLRLSEICARYGLHRLLVFGSVARGTAGPTSDVDLLYELSPGRRLAAREAPGGSPARGEAALCSVTP